MSRVICIIPGVILLPAVLLAQEPAPVAWDMPSFARVIQPMQHALPPRLPIFLWNWPLPRGERLVKMREDGSLRQAIETMAARGIVPTVEMGWDWTPEGAMALAQTLQEAGQPVFLLWPWLPGGEEALYPPETLLAEGPDATQGNKTRKWPCLPLYSVKESRRLLIEDLNKYKAAGIEVAGMWFDYEALPHPWNGCYQAQTASAECRKHYPPGVLDSWLSFVSYAYDLRSRVMVEALVEPVHEVFPQAIVANYGEVASSAAVPFEEIRPPWKCEQDALMPSAYANTRYLAHRFKDAEAVTPEQADRFYFRNLLVTVSSANANKRPGQLSIPYLSRFCPDDPNPKYRLGMSSPAYRELVRHLLLRGSDGLYLFNLGFKEEVVSARDSLESVEDARAAYDELLTWREFLDRGQPMCFDCPAAPDAVIWSGLRLEDRCLVRTFTFAAERQRAIVEVFPGIHVQLEAPPTGATYLVNKQGVAEKVAG